MKIVEAKHRASVLGLVKFIAAVAIVYFHTLLGKPEHFSTLYWLVELFFFITGYYTFKHFQDKATAINKDGIDKKAKKALGYTFNKISSLAPYILVAVIMYYVSLLIPAIENGWHAVFDVIKGLPFDLLLLNTQAGITNWPMWFVSAMVIVMPLFCLLCQSKNKYVLFIFSSLSCLIYYFNFFCWPYDPGVFYITPLIRAFVGMMMGINVYIVAEQLRKIETTRFQKGVLQICEVSVLMFSFILMYSRNDSANLSTFRSLTMMSFFVYLCIFMSGQTVASKISSPVMDFLEKISMITFMIHIPILNIALAFGVSLGVVGTTSVVISSVCVSAVIFCVVKYALLHHRKVIGSNSGSLEDL